MRDTLLVPALILACGLALAFGGAAAGDGRDASSLASTVAEAPEKPGEAQPRGIEYFKGTWCFNDGIRTRYDVSAPNRLHVTRLDRDRIQRLGPTTEFTVAVLAENRFEMRPLIGTGNERYTGRIESETAFVIAELTFFDGRRKQTETLPLSWTARRCGAEIAQGLSGG